MSENINLTGSIFEFIYGIGQYWTRKRGLLLALIFEIVLLLFFGDRIGLTSSCAVIECALGIAILIFALWLITSKRILFRSAGLLTFWLLFAFAIAGCSYFLVYPKLIQGTELDIPNIQIWGTLVAFVLVIVIGLVVDCWVLKGKGLLIVFAVNNESIAVEKTIMSSVDPVVNSIQDSDRNVRLVVLPFGILKSVRSCVKYIKRPLTRADAIVFASVVDDSDSTPAGYVFTNFSSRINEARFAEEERRETMHEAVLDAHMRCGDWNFLNAANDNCSRKIVISKNLEEMLRMYIGCIYLMKHDFKAALPYTNNAIYNSGRNTPQYAIASVLYSYSMLSAARELENSDRDYDAALERLTELRDMLPVNNSEPGYNKAMARVLYYKGSIKESEEYTRRFKDIPGHRWGYELNMGFYAICKKKVLEFTQHYKNLRKYYPYEIAEPKFAIQFLQYQQKNTQDKEYGELLQIAIAYLHLYLSTKKAKRMMEKVHYHSSNTKCERAINEIRDMVNSATVCRDIVPKKK